MRVKTRSMWIPRPTDWNAPPGIATSTSATITAARYARRYGHRDAGIGGVGCAVAVAKVSSLRHDRRRFDRFFFDRLSGGEEQVRGRGRVPEDDRPREAGQAVPGEEQ